LEKQRILVVEDDVRFSEVLQQTMGHALAAEMLDVAFVGAGSISEARALLREGGLDAALIEVRLPDGDGLDLVEEINDGGVGSPMPTLVLTAYLDPKVAIRAIDAGAQGAFSRVAPVPETAQAIIRLIESASSEA
jgi:DNA-binding NtrC family response regulator